MPSKQARRVAITKIVSRTQLKILKHYVWPVLSRSTHIQEIIVSLGQGMSGFNLNKHRNMIIKKSSWKEGKGKCNTVSS